MVDRNNPAGDRYGQFIDLPLAPIAPEPSQPLDRAMVSRNYADADIIHLAAFIRNNPNPILVFSPKGDVIRTNPAAVRLLKSLQVEPLAILPSEHLQIVTGLPGRTAGRVHDRSFCQQYLPGTDLSIAVCFQNCVSVCDRAHGLSAGRSGTVASCF